MQRNQELLKTRVDWAFPGVTVDKNPPAKAGNTGSIPGSGIFYMLGAIKPTSHS